MEDNKEILEENQTNSEEVEPEEVVEENLEESSEEEVDRNILVENNTTFDYRTMKYLNLYIIKNKRKSFIIYLVFSIAMFAVAAFSFISSVIKSENPDYLFPILFAMFAVYMLYQGFNIEKSLDKQLEKFFNGKEVTVQKIELNNEFLYVSRGTCDEMGEAVKVDWVNVNEIHELPQFYYLFMGNNPIVIDKNPECFVNSTLDTLKEIIEEKSATRKYVKIEKDIVKKPITYVHQPVSYTNETLDETKTLDETVSETKTEEIESKEE